MVTGMTDDCLAEITKELAESVSTLAQGLLNHTESIKAIAEIVRLGPREPDFDQRADRSSGGNP